MIQKLANLKAVGDNAANGGLEGYASTYDVDLEGDAVVRGAWTKSIAEVVPAGRVKLFDNHFTYGTTASGVIGIVRTAVEDDKGLYITADFASTEPAQRVRALVRESILSDFSVGFRIIREGAYNAMARVRTITEAALSEVSVVAQPANPFASISRVKNFSGLSSFPVADTGKFERDAAEAAYRKWVNPASESEWNLKDWATFSMGFLYVDRSERKWFVVDMQDGNPVYSLQALKSAQAEIANWSPSQERDRTLTRIGKFLADGTKVSGADVAHLEASLDTVLTALKSGVGNTGVEEVKKLHSKALVLVAELDKLHTPAPDDTTVKTLHEAIALMRTVNALID